MTRKSKFIFAFMIAASIAVIVNVIPYFLTLGAYQHDGQEVAGFPFDFHRVGGDCWPSACDTYNFNIGYFLADLAVALACAVAVGLVVARAGKDRGGGT